MNRITLTYGVIAGVALMVFGALGQVFIGEDMENFRLAEAFGYTTILLSMSLIYFAVRRYRDEVKSGVIGFGRAFAVGVGTDLVASVIYGLFMIVYFKSLNPELLPAFVEYYRDQIRGSGASPDEIAVQLNAFDSQLEMFLNPYFQAAVMFATVFLIGVVVSLISAWLVRRT